MRKRIPALFLVLITSVMLVVSACSSGSKTTAPPAKSDQNAGATKQDALKGKSIQMSVLGIAGWVPSKLSVDLATEKFTKYAKEKYGYDVSFKFAEAPFSALFQKGAASLATKSQEYNIMISDSQWLGALAKPGWIVNVNQLVKDNPELDIKWYAPIVKDSYQTYPDGSDQLWGLPQEADTIVLYVRKDLLTDAAEKKAFKDKFGMDLPQTFEDFDKLTMDQFEKVAQFFNRPDKGMYGTAMQFSKEYDFVTCYLYPFMFSTGGNIWDAKTGKVYGILNSESNAKALSDMKHWLQYMPPGTINYGIAEEADAFTQGKLFSAFQWAAMGPAMIPDNLKGKVLVVPPPAHKNGSKVDRIYTLGGQPWVVNKFNDADHMRVAVDFLKWWYLPETQMEFAKRGGNPSDKATLESPGFDDIQPWFKAYKYMLGHSVDFWHDPKYSEMLAAQQEAFTAFMTGQVSDPKVALEYAACQQQQILLDEGNTKEAPPASCKDVRLK